ncbi:hypothetical protein BDB00DRAFT_870189 [Zychaea mexicana]|uniref:uncharacterized protein n=1 Tax=Zychaea mexicana TaxID=64656 RepID=UPI0022FF2E4F|nr:uncharacterized protein BDB00DRAFT_870189 [Zychaea mexicana]KAI9495642.1 hypothetical protein BDB00DRAFT_870189 [Zychaea mexicana]
MPSSFAPNKIDNTLAESFQKTIQMLNNAIDNNKHPHVVEHAEFLLQNHFLKILDASAHAYAMQGKPTCALVAAERIIDYSPRSAVGYIRKASIYSMYGNQRHAIAVYNDGVRMVESSQEEQILCLTTAREEATKKNESRIDFMDILPTEIVNSVIKLLPKDTTVACLELSKVWRERILECTDAWRNLSVADTQEDTKLVDEAQYIGSHVEHLKLSTTSMSIRIKYLQALKEHHFKKIRSLELTVSDTLTSLTVEITNDLRDITVAEILLSCNLLSNLIYQANSTIETCIGNFSMVSKNCGLTNLELKAKTINGPDIEEMLQSCQKLRRLVMNGCRTSVLGSINRCAPKLEILGYNTDVSVPALKDLKKKTDSEEPGLRVLYTNNGQAYVPTSAIFPLIYKSRYTLEELLACLTDLTAPEVQQFNTTYMYFKLPRVIKLNMWPCAAIQPYLLRSIADSASLKHLCVIAPADIVELTRTIMNLGEPLVSFEIAHVQSINGRPSLIQLFERYARLSETQKSLESVIFRYCAEISDPVLSALSGIKTLSEVTLRGLAHVTTQGIHGLITKLSDQLTRIELSGMNTITDDTMLVLGNLCNIYFIVLNDLKNVTDDGVRGLINKIPQRQLSKLTITIKKCPLINDICIQHATQKVKAVYTT